MAAPPWTEGEDGRAPTYSETLRPPIAAWIIALGLSALMGIAYGAAYGAPLGWAVGSAFAVLGVLLFTLTSIRLRVDDRVVRAGRARLPHGAIAQAVPLDAPAMVAARRHGDPRDYLVLRTWSSRTGVAITLADVRDPHPRWVVTSRNPEAFSAAINAARPSEGGGGSPDGAHEFRP